MVVTLVLCVLILFGSPIPLYIPLCTCFIALFIYYIALVGFEWGRIFDELEDDKHDED